MKINSSKKKSISARSGDGNNNKNNDADNDQEDSESSNNTEKNNIFDAEPFKDFTEKKLKELFKSEHQMNQILNMRE